MCVGSHRPGEGSADLRPMSDVEKIVAFSFFVSPTVTGTPKWRPHITKVRVV